MRPTIQFLSRDQIEKVIEQAKTILCKVGIKINNLNVLALLSEHGCNIDREQMHVFFNDNIISKALSTVPSSFKLYDAEGVESHDFGEYRVYFTPGSSALRILDHNTKNMRNVQTSDYVNYARLMSGLPLFKAQSTAMVPSDIDQNISDSYRLFLSLLYCRKPVITGAFTIGSVKLMKDMLIAVRGSAQELKAKPLALFTCCPLSPLNFSHATSQNILDLSEHSIPVEIVSMPLAGFNAPVTLLGLLTQHAAEILSGIIIGQLARPGLPMLWGGSPAIFDIRYETTPLGAPETMMIDCANNEIGKYLKIPTQAYISLSDSKRLDAQAGLETSMGATLAVLSGINSISGPGMLDFENCQSLEKLIVDHEICSSALRLVEEIDENESFPIVPIMQELIKEKHLLISRHTRKYSKKELLFPGPVIDRTSKERFLKEEMKDIEERAHIEVLRILKGDTPWSISFQKKSELISLMKAEASKYGHDTLPGNIEN